LYTTVISVRVDDAAIFLEQSASWKEERRNRLRHLQEGMLASQEYASRAITVTLQAAYFEASYPSGTNINNETTASNSEVEKAIVDLVRENRQDFIISLRGGDELYFMQVDDLILKSVQDVDALLLESQQSAVSKSSVDDVNAVESGSHVGGMC
jgi:PHD/YefM family antitoxin component YafN of YafNO toxin-antitoxin module